VLAWGSSNASVDFQPWRQKTETAQASKLADPQLPHNPVKTLKPCAYMPERNCRNSLLFLTLREHHSDEYLTSWRARTVRTTMGRRSQEFRENCRFFTSRSEPSGLHRNSPESSSGSVPELPNPAIVRTKNRVVVNEAANELQFTMLDAIQHLFPSLGIFLTEIQRFP